MRKVLCIVIGMAFMPIQAGAVSFDCDMFQNQSEAGLLAEKDHMDRFSKLMKAGKFDDAEMFFEEARVALELSTC